ncbi:glypican-4, partial [Hyalella azteca]|uniref:Glypican-4 n=1 Tax=Hyalella azteca TaxID=294128 RepID=A0A8B7PJ53_HYAAZ
AMVTVGDRLLNPFNIENVVRPINLQISDAVMNFQLAGANISNMVRNSSINCLHLLLCVSYLACVLTYMDSLQPFGDVPAKFGGSIKRSFVALRTFVRGLNTSTSVVNNLLKVNPSVSCVRELMRLTHCSTCQGLPDVRPCLPYCLHVHTHCLHHLQQFSADWKSFVDAMVTVGDRLLNPFNIENVVRPINLQIS